MNAADLPFLPLHQEAFGIVALEEMVGARWFWVPQGPLSAD
ncbi:hypothetical protein P8631_00170 [Guyparkeria sp. 1SP6A2]|nr:hypothetical protein [Guyparkeria sp. 1SP6A2]